MQAEQRGVTLSRVAGYRAWQAMGRQVVKGARSFAVMAPVRRAGCGPRREIGALSDRRLVFVDRRPSHVDSLRYSEDEQGGR